MTSITLTRRQSKRILPQVDVPVIEDNDEMRRFSESVKEHIRMYEGDSGAPKERFVTIEELEHVGLVTTKVQSGFASIDKILGEQINAVPSVLPAPGSPGGGGAAGVRTLRALDDTAVDGISGGQGIVFNGIKFVPKEFPDFAVKNATRYDMLYYDGDNWKHTKQELQWNPDDDYMQLANDHSINWLDTSGATQDFVNFAALTGGAPGAAVGHIISKLTAGVTTTSATYVDVIGATVAFASMEANKDYAVFVRAYIGNSTSTTTAANRVRLTKGGTLVSGSEEIYESPSTTIDSIGMLYNWGGIINAGASGDLQLEHHSGNGSDTVFVNNVTIMMIKVDDLILNTNIFHDTDTSLVELDDGDFPPVFFATGAGVTIGDGTSDYLVFGSVRIQDFLTGGNQVEMRVNDGTTTKSGSEVGRGDVSDQHTMGFMQLWQAPASSTTLSVEARGTGFPVDKVYASIIAIRLDALADYNSAFLATSTDLGSGPTDIVTLAFTAALTGDYGFISGATGPNSGSTGSADFIRNDLNGGGDATIAGSATQKGIANIIVGTTDQPHWGVSADQSLSASDTIDADLNATDAGAPLTWTNNFLIAFRWALSGDAEFFDVGNVGFTTRMKGLSTRFYDPGLTDFVEFDHDGADFNITGFQTVDINITGITSIQAGTVDVDFDEITATTYGAILEANLVDKIAAETIPGDWTWEGRLVTDDSTTTRAGFNIPIGVAPTSPVQGDIWSTASDLFMKLTVGTETNAWISDLDALVLDDLFDVDLTGAADNDLLHRSGGDWIDTAGALTWDGSALATTGIISLPAGTESLPSLAFTGDLDTGAYSPSANIFAITVGGVEAVRWTGASIPVVNFALESGITASTTQTQGQRPLTASYNEVSIVANDNDVVTLPACEKGRLCLVINGGAKKLQLFPASGVDLGQGVNSSVTIEPNSSLFFVGINPTKWHETASDKTYRMGHTYGVISKIKVPNGQKDFIIPFFVSLAPGQTAKLVKARHKINAGTSVTCKLQKNDVDVTGFTAISVTTTAADTDPADVSLTNNDKLALVVTAIAGTPQNMSFTIFLEYTT